MGPSNTSPSNTSPSNTYPFAIRPLRSTAVEKYAVKKSGCGGVDSKKVMNQKSLKKSKLYSKKVKQDFKQVT